MCHVVPQQRCASIVPGFVGFIKHRDKRQCVSLFLNVPSVGGVLSSTRKSARLPPNSCYLPLRNAQDLSKCSSGEQEKT